MEMKKNNCLVIAAACVAGFMSCGMFIEQRLLIYPGTGVGSIKIGDEYTKFKTANSKYINPDRLQKVKSKNGSEMWVPVDELGLILIYDFNKKIIRRIVVKNKSIFVEGKNISVGSSISELRKEYKKEYKEKDLAKPKDGELWYWSVDNIGIKYWINKTDNKIAAIEIYKLP